jgi:hypothetical protein
MIIQVEQRHIYGQIKYYPLNELASRFAALMKQKTFDAQNLTEIRRMGVQVDVRVPGFSNDYLFSI